MADRPMTLTVVIQDACDAANAGGDITRRTVRLELTAEQAAALRFRNKYESYGLAIVDPQPSWEEKSEEERHS